MNRYSDAPGIREVLFQLDLDPWGAGVILVAPGEQGAVAAALEEKLPGAVRAAVAQAGSMEVVPHPVLVVGLGRPGASRVEALSRLNGRREWFSRHRQCVLVLVDPAEMVDLQRHAGDLWAAPNLRAEVAFIPDGGVDVASSRAALAEHLFHKLGRLDLRGFVRSESEDVAFRVEDVFVEVSAAIRPVLPVEAAIDGGAGATMESIPAALGAVRAAGVAGAVGAVGAASASVDGSEPILSWIERAVSGARRPLVVLGAPGAGKTFLLRWVALRAVRETSFYAMEAPFPVLVSLAAFARAPLRPSLFEHVTLSLLEAGQPAAHVLHRMMEAGRVLFLLDGLDEVPNALDRQRIRDGVKELRERAPRCPVVMTSRIVGYERDAEIGPVEVTLSDLDDASIRKFLSRWCELYAVERRGDSALVRAEGRKEGATLAADILASESVRRLAGNPLLLTVLAIVHRAGVRLPEHRVELYDHATRVLVERWNRVRSLEATERVAPAPPLKSADAVRLLGPLALRMVRAGVRSTVSIDVVEEEIGKALDKGSLKGIASVEEAVRLFCGSLGLLVEQAPGVFAFLHLTLTEFFAALELVRTGELEKVAADSKVAFEPEMREVLLLGAGILGVLRAEDARLGTFVDNLLTAAARESDPESEMPVVLVGLLSEDPGLTRAQRGRILDLLAQIRRARTRSAASAG